MSVHLIDPAIAHAFACPNGGRRASAAPGRTTPSPHRAIGRHARKIDFLQRLQRDLAGPASIEKIYFFAANPNHPYNSRHPVPVEGRWPSSRTLGRVAVDAAASGAWSCSQGGLRSVSQHNVRTTGAEAYGKAVWSWHPLLVSSWRRKSRPNRVSAILQSAGDGGKRNSSPGRARYKPSNHCAGNAGLLRLYLYARVRFSSAYCTRDRGC